MKPLSAPDPRITSFSNRLEAARRAQRGKRHRAEIVAFNARLDANLIDHRILIGQLAEPIACPSSLRLPDQILANFHLDHLDHSMAGLPGFGASLRDVNDMALFAPRREDLASARQPIEVELAVQRLRTRPSPQACRDPGRVAQLLRAGSWINDPHNCLAAYRNSNHPGNVNTNVGVRPCCLLPPSTLHRQSRWRGFQREYNKGPDPG